jgi:cytochrome b6-f complex iron-sulfur subunit
METGRREFIKKAVYGALALFGLGFLAPSVAVFSPLGDRKKELVYFPLMTEEELPRSGVRKSELTYYASGRELKARVFVVSSREGITVLSATCSHLGCLVNYHRDKREFVCPCHGGRYDLTGENVAGPPPAPLTRFPTRVQNGVILAGVRV